MKYWGASMNPITGCSTITVSNGCDHCYAKSMVEKRWSRNKNTHYFTVGFKPTVKWYDLKNPKVPKDHVIFVSDMGDPIGLVDFWQEGLWLETKGCIPRPLTKDDAFTAINRLLEIIRNHPSQQFLLLTKRPKALLNFNLAIKNLWVGTTVCEQKEVWKLDWLLKCNAINRWLSIEPMLSEVSFSSEKLQQVHWVVCGGENYNDWDHTAIMEVEWTLKLLNDCRLMGVPFYFKQPGSHYDGDSDFKVAGAIVREYPMALMKQIELF